jgi:alginate O-acetyltransferase complex protein AlgI
MAIGLGRMFGFHFLENFNYPYISKSIQGFWRRWHISLSSWFKDYIYIPLGGNRLGQSRTYANLIGVFLLTGIWHGASWNFIVWGLWHGAFILIERSSVLTLKNIRLKAILSRIYLLALVMIGWVFFRAENLSYALEYIKHLFWYSSENTNYYALYFVNVKSVFILIMALILSTPIKTIILKKLNEHTFFINYRVVFLPMYVFVLMVLCTIEMASNSFNPFIYFRF